jgi:hypothetical protein
LVVVVVVMVIVMVVVMEMVRMRGMLMVMGSQLYFPWALPALWWWW